MRINKVLFIQIVGLLIFNLVGSNHLSAQEKISVVTKSEMKEFVNNASERLIERYVFKEIGEEVASYISRRYEEGVYDTITNAENFTRFMTEEIQSISHDKHMRVRLRRSRPQMESGPDPILDQYFRTLESQAENFGFQKVEILENNVGETKN